MYEGINRPTGTPLESVEHLDRVMGLLESANVAHIESRTICLSVYIGGIASCED